MSKRIEKIKERLSKTTSSNWRTVKSGTEIRMDENRPWMSTCEDDCIITMNKLEVLGCSEWLRCRPEDLTFMANAKSDIKYLLNRLEEDKYNHENFKIFLQNLAERAYEKDNGGLELINFICDNYWEE